MPKGGVVVSVVQMECGHAATSRANQNGDDVTPTSTQDVMVVLVPSLIQYPTQDTGCKVEGDGDTTMRYPILVHAVAVKPLGAFVNAVDSRSNGEVAEL